MLFKAERSFFKNASQLSKDFKKRAQSRRFSWELFDIPDQYFHLKTSAHQFFEKKLYHDFHTKLVQYGRDVLGCHDVSPPWLSAYVSDCYQNFHADVPHGPYAFVYSLTDWVGRKFSGGETLLLKEETLNYWELFSRKVQNQSGIELNDLLHKVAPHFNQLLIFDGRIPHGVQAVQGADNPLSGRIVIHGWFVNPRPFVTGALDAEECQNSIESLDLWVRKYLKKVGNIHGHVSLKLKISAQGKVSTLKKLSSTLRSLDKQPTKSFQTFELDLQNKAKQLLFPRKKSSSDFTLPFSFQ